MAEDGLLPAEVFFNLPVKDLTAATRFFKVLDFAIDPELSHEGRTCLVLGATTYVLLQREERFRHFTGRAVGDTQGRSAFTVALAVAEREQVAALLQKAAAAGGRTAVALYHDEEMTGGGFADLDGHIWELFWMNPLVLKA